MKHSVYDLRRLLVLILLLIKCIYVRLYQPDVVAMFYFLLKTIHTLPRHCERLVFSIFDFPLQDRSTLFTAVQYLENRVCLLKHAAWVGTDYMNKWAYPQVFQNFSCWICLVFVNFVCMSILMFLSWLLFNMISWSGAHIVTWSVSVSGKCKLSLWQSDRPVESLICYSIRYTHDL